MNLPIELPTRLASTGFAVLTLAALGLATACERPSTGVAQASERPAPGHLKLDPEHPTRKFIKIEPVQEAAGATSVALTGRVTFDEDHTQRVSTPIDGRVRQIHVQIGDKVKPGQALLELTSPQVGLLQAEALKAHNDFEVASKALERTKTLRQEGAVSDREAAQVEAEFKKAKAEVGRTSVQLQALGISATDPAELVELRSQPGGTVVERNVLHGQEVRADQALPLLTITSLDSMWIIADVYEQDLGLVQNGAKVVARVPAYPGESFEGTITHVAESVDPTSRTIKVRCLVPNKALKLKAEMFAKIEVSAPADAKMVLVPPQAVLEEGDKQHVIVVAGNTFSIRDIEVGPQVQGMTRVLQGLNPGEQIVTDGALFLRREIDQH